MEGAVASSIHKKKFAQKHQEAAPNPEMPFIDKLYMYYRPWDLLSSCASQTQSVYRMRNKKEDRKLLQR